MTAAYQAADVMSIPQPEKSCSPNSRMACHDCEKSVMTHCPSMAVSPCLPVYQMGKSSGNEAPGGLVPTLFDCKWDASAQVDQKHLGKTTTPAATENSSTRRGSESPMQGNSLLTVDRSIASRLGYNRTITNIMALRILYIPSDMHDHLCMEDMYPKSAAGRRCRSCVVYIQMTGGSTQYPATMVTSSARRHRRISSGWKAFTLSAGLLVGDCLTFTRVCSSNLLVVAVNKIR